MIQHSTKINVQNKTENRCYSHRYDSFHVKEFKYIMHDVQDESVLWNNVVRPVICEGWHFAHMCVSFAYPSHFTKWGSLGT
jgi:hypothetical protein